MARWTQVKRLTDIGAFREHIAALGVDIPVVADVPTDGALAAPMRIEDGSAEPSSSPNRWAILPMEGWDAEPDGSPSDLIRRRWERFGRGGAGLVWGEATAVRPDGRANPHQLVLDESTVDDRSPPCEAGLDPMTR